MLGASAVLVTFVSILVYARTGNYGEAALALVAGLLTVFTVNWTPGLFTVFAFSWVGFSVITLMIASVRLASRTESLYVQAAIVLAGTGESVKAIEGRLRAIGEPGGIGMLGPVERAEVIRILALRRIPIDVMKPSLDAVELLYIPTLDGIYETIRSSPVPAEDFFQAFRECRHLLLSGRIGLSNLMTRIGQALEVGVPASEVDDYISRQSQ